ncbi:MAG: RND family transporter [Halobacterium sp.]
MSLADRVAGGIVAHSRLVVAVMLVATLAVGAGAGAVEQSTGMESFSTDSAVAQKDAYVREHFGGDANTTTALFAVQHPEGNVLSKASLLRTLRFQRALRTHPEVAPTLADRRPIVGVANFVARIAAARQHEGSGAAAPASLTLAEQIDVLESTDEDGVAAIVSDLLAPDSDLPGSEQALQLLPRDYGPGSPTADARLVLLRQATEKPVQTGAAVSEAVTDAQFAARDVAKTQSGPETYRAFGRGFISGQEKQSMQDSFALLGPLALLFVLAALAVAYRDVVDVVLGLAGVVTVLVWTFGLLGWLGVDFNQVMVAVPVLLIALSVDYALHVVMRYREHRQETDEGPRAAMTDALSGVGVALALVTLTTAIGFLANLTSPVPDLREFGLVVALGIGCTLLVFGVLLPAVKTELEALLEDRGVEREQSPFGSGTRFRRVLQAGVGVARRAPVAVLVVVVVTSAAGAYGATTVDTAYDEELFLADDPPAWTDDLPEPLAPGDYFLKENRAYVYSTFQSPDKQVEILVQGDVTRPDALERVAAAVGEAGDASVTFVRGDQPAVASPLSAMERVAARNESFNATLAAADTDGDGVPDGDLHAVYDEFYAAAPSLADRYVHRSGGEYEALRVRVSVVGTADHSLIHDQMRDAAAAAQTDDGSLTATATGQPIVAKEISTGLASTVAEGLAVTLVAVLALLAAVFRWREDSATLGAVTLAPVAFTVAWLFGTMAVLGIQFTLVTALVGSVAVGLGVDYSIHVSERFAHERGDGQPVGAVLERTVVGTGGALLASAVTTAAGFGVLTFSLLPGLAQFGLILAVGIAYSFVASVLVLPSLLVLWERHGRGVPAANADGATGAATDD